MKFDLDAIKFDKDGLAPVIAQDARTGDVLMLAFADRTSLEHTLASGFLHYHSRTRGELWKKGETSGHVQHLVGLHADCDNDTILALVHQEGPACHTNAPTCFAPPGTPTPRSVMSDLAALIEERKTNPPAGSYTAKLLADPNLRLKKVGEEATELVVALSSQGPDRVASEAADLVYHVLVACAAAGVTWKQVLDELGKRRK